MKSIAPLRLNHMNVVADDYTASVAHCRKMFGAELLLDIPHADMHAGLIAFGGVIFELFVPAVALLGARYGPHYLGVEYQADMAEVRAAIADHGIRIVRDIGLAVHTHPADTLGVAFEFYDGEFHSREYELLGGTTMRSAAYWAEHPLALAGLKNYSIAFVDIDSAARFLHAFLGAETIYEADRPAITARSIGLRIADADVELLTPTGPGRLSDHLTRYGQGICSTVMATCDLEGARRYFIDRGVRLEPGATDAGFALPPEAFMGVTLEFAEHR